MSVAEDVVVAVDGAPGVGLIVVEDAVGARWGIAADALARHLVVAWDVQGLAAEGAVGLVELLSVSRLLVGLLAAEVVLTRQGRVVASDEAATRQHAHLPVEVPRRKELALDAFGHRQEVDLLVLVPVDQVPRLPPGACRLGGPGRRGGRHGTRGEGG